MRCWHPNYGAPRHPAWFHNLLANPAATAEIEGATWRVHARVTAPEERAELLNRTMTESPGVTAALGRTSREIPVVVLDLITRVDPDGCGVA